MARVPILDAVHPDGPAVLETAGHPVIYPPDVDAHDPAAAIAPAEAPIPHCRQPTAHVAARRGP